MTKIQSKKEKANKKQIVLIDKFMVPQAAEQEFVERMNINSGFIKKFAGLIDYTVYVRNGKDDRLMYITVAVWENEHLLKKAKKAVQTEYKRQDFNPAEMMRRLNIKMDRNIYKNYIPPAVP